MKPTRHPRANGGSEAPRASPPKALQFKPPTHFRKCMSQSAIESGKSPKAVHCSAPAVRERKARHQIALPVRPKQNSSGGSSNRHREVCSRYGLNTGDHWSSTRNVPLNKQGLTMTLEDRFTSSESQGCDSGSAAGELRRDKSSEHVDRFPSYSSLRAIVQAVESKQWTEHSVGHPFIEADMSGSNTDIDTTWSSWSSDKIGRSNPSDTAAISNCPSPSLRCKSTSPDELFKVHLSVRRESTASSFRAKRKKEPQSSQTSPTKKSISRWKQLNVQDIRSSTATIKNPKSPVSKLNPAESPQRSKVSNQEFRVKQNDFSNSQSPVRNPGSVHQSPRKVPYSTAGRNTIIHNTLNLANFKEAGRRSSPALTNFSSSPSSSPLVPRQHSRHSGQLSSPSRSSHLSPSWGENAKVRSKHSKGSPHLVKTSQSSSRRTLKSHDGGALHLSDAPPLLKLSMTSRSDRSTDSGYQESVSRATLDWFTAWGFISSEMSDRRHKMNSRVTLNPTLSLTTDPSATIYGGQGSGLRETALYSIEDPDFCTQAQTAISAGHDDLPVCASAGANNLPYGHEGENVPLLSTSPRSDKKFHQLSPSTLSRGQVASFRLTQKNHSRERPIEETPEIVMSGDCSEDTPKDGSDQSLSDRELSTAAQVGDASREMLTSESVTRNESDTRGLISNMGDNISEITDVSADWDQSLSSPGDALKLLSKERNVQIKVKDSSPKKEKRHADKSGELKSVSKTEIIEKSATETKTKEEVESAKEESGDDLSMRMLSQSSQTDSALHPARGFNSNTRRTVEINYRLIILAGDGDDVTHSDKQTSADLRPEVNVMRRSSSEPPPQPPPLLQQPRANTQSPPFHQRRHSPTSTTRRGKKVTLNQGNLSAPAYSISPKVLKVINPLHRTSPMSDHRHTSKTSPYLFKTPEPKMFYLGCLVVMSMCVALAFILTSSIPL